MKLEIKRYHFFFLVLAVNLLAAVAIFSRESSDTLQKSVSNLSSQPKASLTFNDLKNIRPPRIPEPASRNNKAPVQIRPTIAKGRLAPNPTPKIIAFTFDDGPHPQMTERLLKILNESQVRATFFVVGKQVELHPELVQKIFSEGHEIANHTYSHRNMTTLSSQDIIGELEKTDRLVASITDQKMKYFRPPGGQYNQEVVESAKNLGYEMVLWTVLPQDHLNPSPELIRDRVLKNVSNQGIVLFHSGIENTLIALPKVISTLRKQGYSFVTISQMRENQFREPVIDLAHLRR